MQVPNPHTVVMQILGQVLGHPLGQRCNQHAFATFDTDPDLRHDIIDLRRYGSHFNSGIDQARWPDNLFHHLIRMLFLIRTWCCRHIDSLRRHSFELVKPQRPVVQRRREPETVFHQGFLAGPVTTIHAAELRYGRV